MPPATQVDSRLPAEKEHASILDVINMELEDTQNEEVTVIFIPELAVEKSKVRKRTCTPSILFFLTLDFCMVFT